MRQLLEQRAGKVGTTTPWACQDWANTKAAYRFLGTLLGAVAGIAIIPNLVDAPELLSAALALWTGGCLYIALLDRPPMRRSCAA